MTGRSVILAAGAFLAMALPAFAQTQMSTELLPLVNAFFRGGAGPDLQKSVDTYIAAHPNDGDGFALRCAIEAQNPPAAGSNAAASLADCAKGVALSPQSVFANYISGDTLYNGGSPAKAIPYYSKAIQLGMTFGGVFWKRCDAYRLTGDLDAALADCKKQLELTPNDAMAQYAYGHLQYVRAKYPDALAYLTSALAIDPKNIDALYWRGLTYAALGKNELADADLTACIGLGDESADTYFERGQVRRRLGRTTEGTADLQEALKRYRANGMDEQAKSVETILASNAGSGSADSLTIVIDGQPYDMREVIVLLALAAGVNDPTFKGAHVAAQLKPAAQMPQADPDWYYAGVRRDAGGTPTITIWLRDTLTGDQAHTALLEGAVLGLADSGVAGAKWKAIYDRAAAQDAGRGPNVDATRRRLAEQLVNTNGSMTVNVGP